jgi:hypothetical protein
MNGASEASDARMMRHQQMFVTKISFLLLFDYSFPIDHRLYFIAPEFQTYKMHHPKDLAQQFLV